MITDGEPLVFNALDKWSKHDVTMLIYLDLLLLEDRLGLWIVFKLKGYIDATHGRACLLNWLSKLSWEASL